MTTWLPDPPPEDRPGEPPEDVADRRIRNLLRANRAPSRRDPEGMEPDVTWHEVKLS